MTSHAARSRQAGVALVTALVLMLVVLLMGVAAARAAIHAEKSARYERDRHIAFAAAEAALADAERDIEGAAAMAPGRAALFDAGPSGLTKACGRGADDLGLCLDGGGFPQWQVADLAAEDVTVGYGSFTGAQMAAGSGTLPARSPRYIIEFISVPGVPPNSGRFFRITAIGFGSREATRVVLQSFYRKPAADTPGNGPGNGSAGGAANGNGNGPASVDGSGKGNNNGKSGASGMPPAGSALPTGRIAWREVANWAELHQAAIK